MPVRQEHLVSGGDMEGMQRSRTGHVNAGEIDHANRPRNDRQSSANDGERAEIDPRRDSLAHLVGKKWMYFPGKIAMRNLGD